MKLSISKPVSEFEDFAFSDNNVSYETCWLNCTMFCRFLHGTKLYPCPMAWTHSEPMFRDILPKENILTEDEISEYSYDLSQEMTADGWDILAKLDNPMKICSKCGDKKVFFKWESVLPQYNS